MGEAAIVATSNATINPTSNIQINDQYPKDLGARKQRYSGLAHLPIQQLAENGNYHY